MSHCPAHRAKLPCEPCAVEHRCERLALTAAALTGIVSQPGFHTAAALANLASVYGGGAADAERTEAARMAVAYADATMARLKRTSAVFIDRAALEKLAKVAADIASTVNVHAGAEEPMAKETLAELGAALTELAAAVRRLLPEAT